MHRTFVASFWREIFLSTIAPRPVCGFRRTSTTARKSVSLPWHKWTRFFARAHGRSTPPRRSRPDAMSQPDDPAANPNGGVGSPLDSSLLDPDAARGEMIDKQLRRRGIVDAKVLAAMNSVLRQE